MATIKQNWERREGGILVPLGTESESSELSKVNYLDTKLKAQEIRRLFSDASVPAKCSSSRS